MNENTDNGKGGGLLPPLPPRQSGIIGYREQRLWALATLEILQQHAPMDKDVEVALEILRTTVSLQDHIDKLVEQVEKKLKSEAWHKKYEEQKSRELQFKRDHFTLDVDDVVIVNFNKTMSSEAGQDTKRVVRVTPTQAVIQIGQNSYLRVNRTAHRITAEHSRGGYWAGLDGEKMDEAKYGEHKVIGEGSAKFGIGLRLIQSIHNAKTRRHNNDNE